MSFPGGYFSYLRSIFSDSEIAKTVKVTSNTTWYYNESCKGLTQNRTHPISLIQRDPSLFYHSQSGKIAKIVFDLGKRVKIKGYAMRGVPGGCCSLKSYCIKGSNDNDNWKEIKCLNEDELRCNYDWHNHSTPISMYRYYGIFQDPDPANAQASRYYYFALSGVDFIHVKYEIKTCFCSFERRAKLLMYIFVASR